MSYRSTLAGAVCALALVASPVAFAGSVTDLPDSLNNVSGVLSGDYQNYDSNNAGNANSYGVSGAVTAPLNFHDSHAELDAGYHHLSGNGSDVDNWNTAGSLYWTPGFGRLGATVGYQQFNGNGIDDVTNYGGFAEWWANDRITLAAKGGGFSASNLPDGYYVGGAATGYLEPDIGLTASVDYTHTNDFAEETDYTASGEWLLSHRVPVSFYAGYTHADFGNGAGHANVVFAGLRLYTDGTGATTLVDRQRTGTLGWDAQFSPVGFRY